MFRFAKGTGQRFEQRPASVFHHHHKPALCCADESMSLALAKVLERLTFPLPVLAFRPVAAMPGIVSGVRLPARVSSPMDLVRTRSIGMGFRYMH